jgi:cysteate synthase
LRAVYAKRQLQLREELPGIFQFSDWLPCSLHFSLPNYELGKPFCYKSEDLASSLKLVNLYIAFSGYWPERGPNLVTRSFKELETQASLAYFLTVYRDKPIPALIVASAGNTGNAYSFMTSLLGLRLYLIVPESGIKNLLLPFESSARVLAVHGDYSEAIQMAEALRPLLAAQTDGGVRNVARRAGMGTVYLNAVVHANQGAHILFDHYFQAVGSGSGAIATWETVQNLIKDGRFGTKRTRIHIAQNEPFTPIADAWNRGSPSLLNYSSEELKIRVTSVTALVLSNRNPAYSVAGGMYDVLTASRGAAWTVNNCEIFEAARTFRELEGIDIEPAGAVTVAALIKAVASNSVSRQDRILLHITSGGRVQNPETRLYRAEPIGVVEPHQTEEALALIQPKAGFKTKSNIDGGR